jgi:hypothetical protein
MGEHRDRRSRGFLVGGEKGSLLEHGEKGRLFKLEKGTCWNVAWSLLESEEKRILYKSREFACEQRSF